MSSKLSGVVKQRSWSTTFKHNRALNIYNNNTSKARMRFLSRAVYGWWVRNTSPFISCTFVPSVISQPCLFEHCYTKGNFYTSCCEFGLETNKYLDTKPYKVTYSDQRQNKWCDDNVHGHCSQEWTNEIRVSGFCLTSWWEKLFKMGIIERTFIKIQNKEEFPSVFFDLPTCLFI